MNLQQGYEPKLIKHDDGPSDVTKGHVKLKEGELGEKKKNFVAEQLFARKLSPGYNVKINNERCGAFLHFDW